MNRSEMKETDRQQPQERQQSEKGWAPCTSGCARGPRSGTRILAIVSMLIVLVTVAMAFILHRGAV